jgi:exonuclease VII large subunit
MQPNESQNFLDEFKQKTEDPFAFLETPAPAPEVEPPAEEEVPSEPEARNRRERRLMEKLQSEREAAIALAAKLDTITQSQAARSEQAQFLEVAERIYGTQTPELREATELLKSALSGVKEEAKREALAEWQSLQAKQQEAIANAEKRIDLMIEEIEDEKNVDLSEGPHRDGFLKLLQKMSPKDRSGNIIEYADHTAVWDIYQSQIKKPANPAKDMAARAMTQGGTGNTNLSNEVHDRWARENGFL